MNQSNYTNAQNGTSPPVAGKVEPIFKPVAGDKTANPVPSVAPVNDADAKLAAPAAAPAADAATLSTTKA